MVQTSKAAPEGRSDILRREILQAASVVFREKGFHRAGMRDIAASLGIAVGKLYYYFKSKQELLAFCQRDCLQNLNTMAATVAGAPRPASEALYGIVVGHLRCLNEDTPGSLAHLEVESLDEPERRAILRLRRRYEAALRDLIARGVGEGTFRRVDPKLAALAILGAVNWSVKWYRPEGGVPLSTVAASFAEQLVRGLMVRPESFVAPNAGPSGRESLLEIRDDA